MEADFMAQRERFRFSSVVALSLLLPACSTEPGAVAIHDRTVANTTGGRTYVDSKLFTGTLYALSADGDTLEMKSYEDGREHGLHREFYDNGQLKSERMFNEGKKKGIHRTWWPNGVLQSEHPFRNDEFEGRCRSWSPEGTLLTNKNYKEGHEHGRQQQWDSNGRIWANYEARHGRQYGLAGTKACATPWGDSTAVH